jgi:hypothetical protein
MSKDDHVINIACAIIMALSLGGGAWLASLVH